MEEMLSGLLALGRHWFNFGESNCHVFSVSLCDSRHKVKLLLLSVNCKVGSTNIKPCVGQSEPTGASFVLRHAAALFPLHAGHAAMPYVSWYTRGATEEIRCAASHVTFRLAARGDIEAWRQSLGCEFRMARAQFQKNRNTEQAENLYLEPTLAALLEPTSYLCRIWPPKTQFVTYASALWQSLPALADIVQTHEYTLTKSHSAFRPILQRVLPGI